MKVETGETATLFHSIAQQQQGNTKSHHQDLLFSPTHFDKQLRLLFYSPH